MRCNVKVTGPFSTPRRASGSTGVGLPDAAGAGVGAAAAVAGALASTPRRVDILYMHLEVSFCIIYL